MPIRIPGNTPAETTEKPGSGAALARRKAASSGIYSLCIAPNGEACDLTTITKAEAAALIPVEIPTGAPDFSRDARILLAALGAQTPAARLTLVRQHFVGRERPACLHLDDHGDDNEARVAQLANLLQELKDGKVDAQKTGLSTFAVMAGVAETGDAARAAVNLARPTK